MLDAAPTLEDEIRKLLDYGDLPFADFVEMALYHPTKGYYSRASNPVGKDADYTTGPRLSEVFGFSLSRLAREFLERSKDAPTSLVDIGCGDGTLIRELASQLGGNGDFLFYGVDRSLSRSVSSDRVRFVSSIDEVPRDRASLWIANELFDALPFTRVVQREEHLHELWVTERDGALDWKEHEASAQVEDYFRSRQIALVSGQFADISLEWDAFYRDLAARLERGLLITFDYGFPEKQLFDSRIRRFGTAASYRQQQVSRDLLTDPGERDLTAHINFSDLIRAGEESGLTTLFFDRQARFLLALGITEHERFAPVTELELNSIPDAVALRQRREDARRLVLPDGIGEDIRVLVQARGVPIDSWSFQRKLF